MYVCIPRCCYQSDLNILRNLNKRVLKLILGCRIQLVRAGPCLCYAIASLTLAESKLCHFYFLSRVDQGEEQYSLLKYYVYIYIYMYIYTSNTYYGDKASWIRSIRRVTKI